MFFDKGINTYIQWNLKCHLDFLIQSAIDSKENLNG